MERRGNTGVHSLSASLERNNRVGWACLCTIALSFLLDGCSGSSGPKQMQDSLESWSRSIDLGTEEWHEHRVPDLYLEQLLDAATNEKMKDERQIAKLNGGIAQSLLSQTHQLETKIDTATSDLARVTQKAP